LETVLTQLKKTYVRTDISGLHAYRPVHFRYTLTYFNSYESFPLKKNF